LSDESVPLAPHARPGFGPAVPSPDAAVALRPLPRGAVRISSGLLADWQERNRVTSLPLALRQLEAAGNLDNLRLVIDGAHEGYRGPAFMDSDIYKTLEAISWELSRSPSAELAEFAHGAVALLEKAQQADGYLNSYVQVTGKPRYANLAFSHELYCAGHMIQAAVAAHRSLAGPSNAARWGEAAGSPEGVMPDENGSGLFGVGRRFADHLVKEFLGTQEGLDGHPIVETALVELYRETGHEPYLRLASQFIEQRGHGRIGDSGFGSRYLQDHQPVRVSRSLVGHAVRALYLEAGVVDVAVETGDTGLLAGSLARWADMVTGKTCLTGSVGSRHDGESLGDRFELPPDRAYNETCSSIANFQWNWRLLLATGEAKYADLMERVLYNGFAAGTSIEGDRFFYVNPLQRRADHFERDDPGRRRRWYSCACCPPNIMRLVASLEYYLATVAGDTLHLHHFTGASVAAGLAGGTFAVEMATSYPWSGAVTVQVTSAPPAECGLAIRVPGWSTSPSFLLNGRVAATAANDYLVLRRQWRPGDVVTCDFGAVPRLVYPGRRIDALRGSVAVQRGPLVYCFEQADQPAGVDLEDVAVTPGALADDEQTLPGIGSTIRVAAEAVRLPAAGDDGLPYHPQTDGDAAAGAVTATAIPYFQWDNRDGRAMRVWLPLRQPAVASQPASPPARPADQAD
jgi:uncharacterized protein